MSKNNTYNLEFKKMIVAEYDNGMSVSKIVNDFKLKEKTVYAWIRLYSTKKSDQSASKEPQVVSLAEHELLKKQLKEAQLDVEILKKSISIFSKK
jgi:transposase